MPGTRWSVETFERADRDAAPRMRWWWFGPDVEHDELERELTVMADAGIGGVEIATVYPLEVTSGRFLDEAHRAALRFAAVRARELGLTVDLTLGTGWPYGGPHVDDATAARRLAWSEEDASPDGIRLAPGEELVAVYALGGAEPELLRAAEPAEGAPLLVARSAPTGQRVKRAAAGAEGHVLDHYSAAALEAHLREVAAPLVEAAGAENLDAVFCDSLEVYGADWTRGLPAEFAERRGYELLPVLWRLRDAEARELRADVVATLTELLDERFIAPLASWAEERGLRLRIQAYGEPPASPGSYRSAHLIEGELEGCTWRELSALRWASSAAAAFGRTVVSSETWTWVHSPSFRATPLDLVAEAHDHLLSGINRFYGHGWPYTSPDAEGLGWFFYAAGCLDERNPWWGAAPSLTAYLGRLCSAMRVGDPLREVGLVLPVRDVASSTHDGDGGLHLERLSRRWIGDDLTAAIRETGHDYDLIDDTALDAVDPARYPIIVLPLVETVTPVLEAWLTAAEASGARVVSVGGSAARGEATDVGGLRRLLGSARPPLVVTGDGAEDVGVAVRRSDADDVFLVANTGTAVRTVEVETRDRRASLERWDALTGTLTSRHPGDARIGLTLAPCEAVLLVAGEPSDAPVVEGTLVDGLVREAPLEAWTVEIDGEPVETGVPHRWEDDARIGAVSGTVAYTAVVEIDGTPGRAVLVLGDCAPEREIAEAETPAFRAHVTPPLGEVAAVSVNGEPAGVVLTSPYRLEIGGLLREGRNLVRLEVSNTAAAAVAADAAVAPRAERVAERWGERFTFQELDRALEDVSSGILGRPVVRY